ncbi:MAG: serine/threonine-protein kinase [Isosphaeraceae bacterium]
MSEPYGASPRPEPACNLLFGLIALHNGLISREDLISALRGWSTDRGQMLGEILEFAGALRPVHRAMLEPLVEAYLALHGGDPTRSLRAFRGQVGASTAQAITQIRMSHQDPVIEASLAASDTEACSEETIQVSPPDSGPPSTWGAHAGGSPAGRFRILRPHARGGLGQVYVARDEELGREVALKEIQEDKAANPNFRARFLVEAEINGNLEHPGIVPVYGLGTHPDGRPFYAMRFIQGDSLREAIEQFHTSGGSDPVAFRKLLGRFVDVCEAIAYAHSRGVLHRDLKPANVMLGKHGETLIIDWGLAKAVGQPEPGRAGAGDATISPTSGGSHEPTAQGSALGTPQYMSPEQAAGRIDQLGPASDVYGLGAILYALLVGKAPVWEGTIPIILEKVRRGEITPPRQVRPRIPKALDAVCMKALALRPEDRYASASALAEDVERWLADEPTSARREPFGDRIRRWGRRHRAWVFSGAVALVLLVGVLGASTVLLGRANERTREQEQIAKQNLRESSRVVAEMLGKVVAKLPDLKSMDSDPEGNPGRVSRFLHAVRPRTRRRARIAARCGEGRDPLGGHPQAARPQPRGRGVVREGDHAAGGPGRPGPGRPRSSPIRWRRRWGPSGSYTRPRIVRPRRRGDASRPRTDGARRGVGPARRRGPGCPGAGGVPPGLAE